MHDHGQTLALAAAAIDFELDSAERAELRAGIEACPLCRRQVAAMRATATILARPSDIGTPSRVRGVVVGAAARGGRRASIMRPLLVAAASLLVVLGGTAVVVGNRGSAVLPPASSSPGLPVQTATAPASPPAEPATPAPEPSVAASAPAETATPPGGSPVPADTGPLQVGEIAAMATTGRLVIRTQPGKGTDSAVYKTNIYPGQRMLILDGPVDASGYPWFRVRLGSIEGWVAASSLTGEPWLVPIRNGRIAFVQDLGDASEAIYTIDPGATGGQTQLLADPSLGRYAQLTWSPDGRRLAFVATPTGPVQGPSEIFIVDADGSNLVQVTNNDVDDDSPAWSPDSQRIAFRQTDPNPTVPGGSSLVVLVRADGGPVKVLGPGANATWSPDGQQLAMTVADGGSSRVWVQGADGTGRRQLADVSVAYARPAWSPDGQNLIVSSSGLFQVGVASGSVTSLSAEPGVMPAWSPGGSIAFTTSGSASPGVFVVGPDGIGPREISHDPGLGAVPVWSPDGRQVLLANDVHAPAIVVVDPTSGTLSAIAGDGTRGSPAWQPRLP